jgi:hypothetical protein
MKRYVIERDTPEVALAKLARKAIAGFAVTKVAGVPTEIGPMTAYSN